MATYPVRILLLFILAFLVALSSAGTANQWSQEVGPYKKHDLVPVTCLNRTIDTGEHITDSHGNLQFIHFPSCAETKAPLAFHYLSSADQNCTITLTDPLFHLLEFYIHNDAPLTCRVPTYHIKESSPEPAKADSPAAVAPEAENWNYVPLLFGLSGTLQRSHLHVAHELNVAIHTAAAVTFDSARKHGNPFTQNDMKKMMNGKKQTGAVDSAAAYSVSPLSKNKRIVIGDELTLEFHVRWFEGKHLPSKDMAISARGSGILVPLMFGIVIGFGLYHLQLKVMASRKQQHVLPTYNGYGYGLGAGAHAATGKRD